jgi:hypothetical protein
MIRLRPKHWTSAGQLSIVSAAVLISVAGLSACSPRKSDEPAAGQAAKPAAPVGPVPAGGAGETGETGETGAHSAYSGVPADSLAALHIAHLRGFYLIALAQKEGPEMASILASQGMSEAYDQSAAVFNAAGIDQAVLRKAATSGMAADLKAAGAALDAGLTKAGGDPKAVIRGLVEISSGLYKGVLVDGGVDPIEYQHSLGAALSAKAALAKAVKADPSLAGAVGPMDAFVALWPATAAPDKPAAYGVILAQASRIELALN